MSLKYIIIKTVIKYKISETAIGNKIIQYGETMNVFFYCYQDAPTKS
jgi:hypothetical protein